MSWNNLGLILCEYNTFACTENAWNKICTQLYIISKHSFIIPNDAHNYKIIGKLKTIKIPTIAPTRFGSRRNHHQGAISCLAKTTIIILLCSSLMTWSMSWRHTSLLCKRAVHGILIVFNITMIL